MLCCFASFLTCLFLLVFVFFVCSVFVNFSIMLFLLLFLLLVVVLCFLNFVRLLMMIYFVFFCLHVFYHVQSLYVFLMISPAGGQPRSLTVASHVEVHSRIDDVSQGHGLVHEVGVSGWLIWLFMLKDRRRKQSHRLIRPSKRINRANNDSSDFFQNFLVFGSPFLQPLTHSTT